MFQISAGKGFSLVSFSLYVNQRSFFRLTKCVFRAHSNLVFDASGPELHCTVASLIEHGRLHGLRPNHPLSSTELFDAGLLQGNNSNELNRLF